MVEGIFEQSFSVAGRLAAVRAASIATAYRLPSDSRRDLEQEALLELWRKRPAYNPERGSWRTFAERVVANRISSVIRGMRSQRSGQYREEPLETLLGVAAPNTHSDLRMDVSRVLASLSTFDRSVALCLIDHSAIETSHKLVVSRATVYRAIARLRTAFAEAGLCPLGDAARWIASTTACAFDYCAGCRITQSRKTSNKHCIAPHTSSVLEIARLESIIHNRRPSAKEVSS